MHDAAALYSSVRRLLAGSPRACDVGHWFDHFCLKFPVHSTFRTCFRWKRPVNCLLLLKSVNYRLTVLRSFHDASVAILDNAPVRRLAQIESHSTKNVSDGPWSLSYHSAFNVASVPAAVWWWWWWWLFIIIYSYSFKNSCQNATRPRLTDRASKHTAM